MDETTKESLKRVIEYLYRDEELDWEAQDKPETDHIFLDLMRLANWLGDYK